MQTPILTHLSAARPVKEALQVSRKLSLSPDEVSLVRQGVP
jgi:hypothetical protein